MQKRQSNHGEHTGNETVVCIHSSGNSSKQWSSLSTTLDGQFNMVAIDLYGAGSSPAWNKGILRLEDEVEAVMQTLEHENSPFHLVGHSYGGAVASRLAQICPGRVKSLSLYEPVLFRLLDACGASPAARSSFREMQAAVRQLMWLRQPAAAARHFVDYWSGAGSWSGLPEWAQSAMVRKMPKIFLELGTPDHDQQCLEDYGQLDIPTLLLWGEQAPSSTREIVRMLMRAMKDARGAGLSGVGHMGPVTHPDIVNPLIKQFIEKHADQQRLQLAA